MNAILHEPHSKKSGSEMRTCNKKIKKNMSTWPKRRSDRNESRNGTWPDTEFYQKRQKKAGITQEIDIVILLLITADIDVTHTVNILFWFN